MNTPALIAQEKPNHKAKGFVVTFLITLYYLYMLNALIRDYGAVEWAIYGYRYAPMDGMNLITLIIASAICSFTMPKQLTSTSSLFLIFSYAFLILPSFMCLMAMESLVGNNHIALALTIAASFSIACLFTISYESAAPPTVRLPSPSLQNLVAILSVLLIAFLFYRFGSIMEFSSLDTIYTQRSRGAAKNFIDGYAQTYSQYVFSTGLVAFGLYRKNILLVAIGYFGSITNFAITAEKAGLIYPVFMVILYFALRSKHRFLTSLNFILAFFATVMLFSLHTRSFLAASDFICWNLGVRTILTPGISVVNYADFFGSRGYTYLSHVRGLDIFITAPQEYANDPRWPALGLLVGEDWLQFPTLNANASYLASDGIASFGTLGCFIAFAFLVSMARALDTAGKNVPTHLLLPLLLPIALHLTNGSALTILTSFGGLFWIFALYFGFAGQKIESNKPSGLTGTKESIGGFP